MIILLSGRRLVASQKPLTDFDATVTVCMTAHLARRADDQRRSYLITFLRLSLLVTNNQRVTSSAFPAGILWIDPAGDDSSLVPRFVFAVAENAPLHPEGSLYVSLMTIAASLRFQVAEVFEHQDGGSLFSGKLDNAMADLVSKILVTVMDFAPEVHIVLFSKCKQACF
jgi:hypothetical protein